jgi:perosamine synthetase
MSTPIDKLILPDTAEVRGALAVIDRNAQGAAFIVDATGRLCGVLTDGDIRRALLAGCDVSTPVRAIMKREFASLPATASAEEVFQHLRDSINIIPLVDNEGHPVDYACFHRYHKIPVMEPALDGHELDYVIECLTTNWISSQGAFVKRFEECFADFLRVEQALTTSNGTAALHLALAALGIGPGDEVIVPDLTFAASINAVLYTGARPVLVDVDAATWTMDPEIVEASLTERTRAIMPVHLYGHPCDMDRLLAVAKQAGCFLIEDCAESLGSECQGVKTGVLGDAGCFSFFGNKVVTTGEGGMVVFRDAAAAQRARTLRDHGMSKERRYWHDHIGFNYRLTSLQAAVGVAQMERVEQFFERRAEIVKEYDAQLTGLPGITLGPRSPWGRHVHWLYCLLLDDTTESVRRDELLEKLSLNGIESRPVFYPLHQMPPYKEMSPSGTSFPVSERISRTGISLPCSYRLKSEEIRHICETITRVLRVREDRVHNC